MGHLKAGNSKIHTSCLISTLPTHVCFGLGKQCKKCYAVKAERMYPNVLPSREKHLAETLSLTFVSDTISEIVTARKTKVRIHESGDFYSQEYLNKWIKIAEALPQVNFYSYTKKVRLDYSNVPNNLNIIKSITDDGGYNYGDMARIKQLAEDGYYICPCGLIEEASNKNKGKICMNTCDYCLTNKRVAFLEH